VILEKEHQEEPQIRLWTQWEPNVYCRLLYSRLCLKVKVTVIGNICETSVKSSIFGWYGCDFVWNFPYISHCKMTPSSRLSVHDGWSHAREVSGTSECWESSAGCWESLKSLVNTKRRNWISTCIIISRNWIYVETEYIHVYTYIFTIVHVYKHITVHNCDIKIQIPRFRAEHGSSQTCAAWLCFFVVV